MTDSLPAPGRSGAWFRFLQRTADVSKGVSILLVTLVALRFAIASVQRALAVSQSNFAEKPARHEDSRPHASASTPHPSVRAPATPATAAPSIPAGQPRSVTLGVSAGPPRSDVYVYGRKVGQTPFLGDTSCKTGQTIRIEIVPPKGPPLVYSRDCTGGALEISGPPP